GGTAIGMIGSTRTTNEENYLLQKFARLVLKTNNIDHHRTADFPALAAALKGTSVRSATMHDVFSAPAILLIGNNPTDQHPLLAYNIRNNVRLHKARLYCVNSYPIKLRRQAAGFALVPRGTEASAAAFLAGDDSAAEALLATPTLDAAANGMAPTRESISAFREKLRAEKELIVIFGSE